MGPFDPFIERHLIRTEDSAIPFIWLGIYGVIILNGLISNFGDNITEVIALAGIK
jgi:hypothetical protein